MAAALADVATNVPLDSGRSVTIEPGQPWPSAYRGSTYSVVTNDDFDGAVLKWEHRDLSIFTDVPDGLRSKLQELGKEGGFGSIRVTAGNEILTKVPAETYRHVDEAPVDSGWIPVYVGKLEGAIDFDVLDLDPRAPEGDEVRVWRGFPFSHGERWSVSHDGKLVWKWRDYRFESAFDHTDIVSAYEKYRERAGRFYITENGHVWINVPNDDIPAGSEEQIRDAVSTWQKRAEEDGDTATLRLVKRRLDATSGRGDPSTGHFPIHLGHLSDFDDGRIPRAVVDDRSYFAAVCKYETVWE